MKLPAEATRLLSRDHLAAIEAWWAGLDDAARAEFTALYDERAEDTAFYATIVDGKTEWHELPIELHGMYVDPENAPETAMWKQELCEFISNTGVQFFLVDRTFHICRAHSQAREALACGAIPAGFTCPFEQAACPFEQALAARPGQSIVLLPRLRGRPAGPT
ncbi:hypothetical protein SAMN02745121_03850 [Nannocystis exedens]|uniref:Uncharacterized protein n=1 Tax=Nannocystis exedens TaxID=54 RepID=A0A1I1ZQA8_9BACT|nr:hypothetical protein [Nannocystis exedens]PCC75424.1 hypothetical protein NAEX_08534 [Nannocystis exedens]SFE32783.1 hypothetical protein SAMN02745121_03850 [Nannocystis exedens]